MRQTRKSIGMCFPRGDKEEMFSIEESKAGNGRGWISGETALAIIQGIRSVFEVRDGESEWKKIGDAWISTKAVGMKIWKGRYFRRAVRLFHTELLVSIYRVYKWIMEGCWTGWLIDRVIKQSIIFAPVNKEGEKKRWGWKSDREGHLENAHVMVR